MSRSRDFRITDDATRKAALAWILALDLRKFEHGLDLRLTVHEERHTDAQRRLLEAVLADIAEQVEWGEAGAKLDADTWRALIVAEVTGGRVVPGISGGAVLVGGSSKRLSVRRMGDVIDFAFAFGAEKGVKFRERRQAA